jgi:hypothetical protein
MINFFTAPHFSEDSVQGPSSSSQEFYSALGLLRGLGHSEFLLDTILL